MAELLAGVMGRHRKTTELIQAATEILAAHHRQTARSSVK
jgi:hypothetical protein